MTEKEPLSGYLLLRHRLFQLLWFANLVSGLGLVMMQLASGWAMATMSSSPLVVAGVQLAFTVPAFLLSIPFGLMADRFGKRRTLLAAQICMLLPECVLAIMAWRGMLTPWLLLVTLALAGTGVVLHVAAWKPLLCEMFPGERMIAAISLNSLGSKIGKVVGPAIGGYLTGLAGVAIVLAARIVGHLVVLHSVWRTPAKPNEAGRVASPESKPSIRDGWRFLRRTPHVYGPMLRCAVVMAPFSGLLALLPLDAKDNIQTEVLGYGGLLTALGLGTVVSMSLMPWFQRHFTLNSMSTVALSFFALSILGISRWDSMFLDALFLLVLGFAFGIVTVSHQVSVQISSPDTLKALMAAFHEVAQQGAMVAGSFIFGIVAERTVVSTSILCGGILAAAGVLLALRYPLPAVR
jgi:MFS family permease